LDLANSSYRLTAAFFLGAAREEEEMEGIEKPQNRKNRLG
jgi:hypothetical protein